MFILVCSTLLSLAVTSYSYTTGMFVFPLSLATYISNCLPTCPTASRNESACQPDSHGGLNILLYLNHYIRTLLQFIQGLDQHNGELVLQMRHHPFCHLLGVEINALTPVDQVHQCVYQPMGLFG